MAGTKAGGQKAAETNKRRHGAGFYARIGAIGGKKTVPKGFGGEIMCDCEMFTGTHNYNRCAGTKGGRVSVRGKRKAANT